ncbi:oxygen-independent coproporphyrinogen III oxidase [Rhodopseudomonas palustris]|uniref:Coproporphyrinogen-III oxidase n=1 Tax=Thiospirillum jenense TaxID=1653858 RepID=A0A839H5J2_9GAMM|nr:oxygen-independent coproporphyrinogen III oxidase [Thiospirillum jenense]MBB1089732.1 oxygen-independent coproporphyrinogen III oxidase [Rhodopseudomonas palustris]MBB1124834.1 oxygen-independent coproporphyrinogen III oxidase [Thiospirillum jenense]
MTAAAPMVISPDVLKRLVCVDQQHDRLCEAPTWLAVPNDADYRAALAALHDRVDETLALYIHIPFCPGRCLYCGCNTTVTHNTQRIDRYLDRLEMEIELVAPAIASGRDVLQLHIAGGTPNYLGDAQLTRLIEMIERRFRILPETDTSIECDPRRSSAGQLELLHSLGLRRITFGVQDLEPRVQRAIGRIQSIDLVRDVYWMAREIGFESISFDLIYGLPEQTEASFQATVEAVIELGPDRVACFGYSRGTEQSPHQHAIDCHRLPTDTERARLFERAVELFTNSGYVWIGLDTFVLDSDELALAQEECRLQRNPIGYTAMKPHHLLGFGAGAVADINGYCVQNETTVEAWAAAINRQILPIARGYQLTERDRCRRNAVGHFVCNLALPWALAEQCMADEYHRLTKYVNEGLIAVHDTHLCVTPKGRYFLRQLCTEHDAWFVWDRAQWHFSRTS